jgi:hypothetical protein
MELGKALIVFGLVLAAVGLLVLIAPGLRLGRLPGDLTFGGSGWRVYVPLGTCLLLSILLTLALSLFDGLMRRR